MYNRGMKKKLFCEPEIELPMVTVEDKSGLTALSNCLVKVKNIATTFYVDKRHRVARIGADIVEDDTYDIDKNPLDLRNQLLFTTRPVKQEIVDTLVYFDKLGKPHIFQ